MKLIGQSYIETDLDFDNEFFKAYLDEDNWVEANILYGSRITEITQNKEFENHYINHISEYDMRLKRLVISIFKKLCINSKDFRCDFFLTKAGGTLPEHIDSQSNIALLIPLSKNTGDLLIKDSPNNPISVCYQKMIALNTQKPHTVMPPKEDRLMFRIGVHDFKFEEMVQEMVSKNKLALPNNFNF